MSILRYNEEYIVNLFEAKQKYRIGNVLNEQYKIIYMIINN